MQKRATRNTVQPTPQANPLTPGIVCGDCVVAGEKLPPVFRLGIFDPPYGIGYKYDDEFQDDMSPSEYVGWARQWLQLAYEKLTPDGTFWLIIGDAFVSELDVMAKSVGFHKRSHVIQYFTFGVNCTKKFTPSHVHLLYYIKDPKHFTFNAPPVRVPSMRQLEYNDKRQNPNGRLPDDTWILNPRYIPEGFRADEDTWTFSRVAGTFKERAGTSNQLPEPMVARMINATSNPGDWVLDFFAGSGTVPTVAKKLGRSGFGIELSKTATAIASQRFNSASNGDALAGATPQG